MFAADKLTYKIRHIYGGAVTDYRAFTRPWWPDRPSSCPPRPERVGKTLPSSGTFATPTTSQAPTLMALADITALLDDLARDQGSILAPEARVRALEAARLQYSSDHPRALPRT